MVVLPLLMVALLAARAAGEKAKKAKVVPLEELRRLEDKAAYGVLRLTDQQYDKLVLQPRDRNFGVFTVFTAGSSKYGCKHCPQMESDFRTLAQSYVAAARAAGGQLGPDPVFFVMMDYAATARTFQKYAFKSVPVAIYSPPREATLELIPAGGVEVGHFETFHGSLDLENLQSFISQQARANFEVVKSTLWVYVVLILGSAGMVLAAPVIIGNLPFIMKKVRSKTLWMFVCAAAYTCSISGFVYDIIRSPPPFYVDRHTNAMSFFHPNNGQQFVVEGFIIGFLNIACAIVIICLVNYASTMQSKQTATNAGLLCLFLFSILYWWIISLYKYKNRWYMRT